MSNYILNILAKFGHKLPTNLQIYPPKFKPINYSAKAQYSDDPGTSPPLNALVIRRVQKIPGALL